MSFQDNETSLFTQPLIDVNAELVSMVASTINGKIIGFLQINNSIGCISCRKKVVPNKDSEDLGQCKDCKLTQIILSCGTQWYMRILVQSSTNPSEQRRLTLYHQQIQKLITHMKLDLYLNSVSKTDMTLAILKESKAINITYNSHSNKVQTIS